MENIYLIAWGATAIIAVYALNKWNDFEAWYHDLDKWWDANYTYILDSRNRFAILYDRAFKAAQDLDKQVTDYRYVIAENNIKIAMLEKQVSDCHEIIDDLYAEVAMLHTNITEMFMENQALEAERNGYYKELEKYTNKPKCPKCHRFLGKDGVCSNEKCQDQYRDVAKKVKDDDNSKTDKPLLADAKVGDLCQRRDGKWIELDVSASEHKIMKDGSCYPPNGRCSDCEETKFDIIATEPLAPEGSKEWAKQMLLLGHKITNIDWITYSAYQTKYVYLDGDTCKFDSMSEGTPVHISYFESGIVKKTGWKIYGGSND